MNSVAKSFETSFQAISYGVVLSGFLSLSTTGDFGTIISSLFVVALAVAWYLEGTRWQLSEKLGTVTLFILIPLFYISWKFKIIGLGSNETALAGMLARMILALAVIKLFQKKSDRDWLFLYLMVFFQVLLAAGLSISPIYFVSLVLYLLVSICAIITFEIRKTSRSINDRSDGNNFKLVKTPLKKIALIAVSLMGLIAVIAVPLFFAFPRTGGASYGNSSKGLTGFTGFSDSVELGAIGLLKQNNEIVMRIALEDAKINTSEVLRWRGVALDSFDNRIWTKSNGTKEPFVKFGDEFVRFDHQAGSKDDIAIQTIYLEPINSDVLFSLSRPFAVSESKLQMVFKDRSGNLSFPRSGFERIAYSIYSDRRVPEPNALRRDGELYPDEIQKQYLQLPFNYDKRIAEFAREISYDSSSRYDKAKSIESYLQTQFGYTLEMKATGDEPLSDFLFNVREGHCEYFATAMTVMLRTQGIAARIVNGFQQGEYNQAAGAYIVRQRDAHSWVEVYFPSSDSWIAFDPTPFAGQFNSEAGVGILGSLNKYIEALETLWIQYFVAYDNQDQRSLYRSVKSGFDGFQDQTSSWMKTAETIVADWWQNVRGDKGIQTSLIAVAYAIGSTLALIFGIFLIVRLYRKMKKVSIWKRIRGWLKRTNEATIIEFYERMQKVLENKGFTREPHQTPLEFAFALNMPEAVKITEKYNRVRFGEMNLSNDEAQEIENWLKELETTKLHKESTKEKMDS